MKKFSLKFVDHPFTLYYITDSTEAKAAVTALLTSEKKIFGLDLETARIKGYENYENPKRGNKLLGPKPGLDAKLSDIRLIQVYDGKAVYVFDAFHVGFRFFFPLLERKQFIAHNGTFEIKQLLGHGFKNPKIHCSMLMAMLVDRAERSPFVSKAELEEEDELEEGEETAGAAYKRSQGYSLDAIMERVFNIRISKKFQTSNWNAPDLSNDQICYAGLDAVCTYNIGRRFKGKIKEHGMMRIYTTLRRMQHVVAEMENNGFLFSKKIHEKIIWKWNARKAKAEKETAKYFPDVNLRSPKQMGEWLERTFADRAHILRAWPKSPSSTKEKVKYSFNRTKIGIFVKNPAIAAYINFKKIDRLVTSYGESLLLERHPIDRCLHTSFSNEPRTGRFSSYNPNLQNIPRIDKKDSGLQLRHAFIAGKDRLLVVGDYSQIEMRIAAELSQDKTMKKAFEKGIDLHKLIVASVLRKKMSEVTDEERQLGKAINFGFLFGMGAKKFQIYAMISYGVNVSENQAWDAWNTFHKQLYPGYSKWCDHRRAITGKVGFARTPLGKIRKLHPDEQYTRAVNTPVQGGAAEVLFSGMLHLYDALRDKPHIKIINTVHDEIIISCPKEGVDEAHSILNIAMVAGMKEIFPNACLKGIAEIHSGRNWQEAKTGVRMDIEE